MTTTRKKPKAPGDNDGGVRVERASDKPRRLGVGGPIWTNPRDSLSDGVITLKMLEAAGGEKLKPTLTIVEKAIAAAAGRSDLVGAILIAQALDRLGAKLIDAAAVSRYRSGP